MDYNFHALRLDDAYREISALDTLARNSGEDLERRLVKVIANLQKHWKGNDATLHVNNLIAVCKGLNTITNSVKEIAGNVSMSIVRAQTIRNKNANGGEVGSILRSAPSVLTLTELENTEEYFVDPIGTPEDLRDLEEICSLFQVFCNNFSEYKTELLDNWTEGSDRPKAVSNFEEFESNVDAYTKKLNDAKGNLATAVSNLKFV